MVLLCALAVPWFVYGPFGIVSYVGGMFNCVQVFLVIMLLGLPALVAAPFFLFEVVYAPVIWRRATPARRRGLILRIVLAGGLGCPFMLGLIGLTPTPFDIFARGFVRYVDRRADIEAIRSWAATLDPNEHPGSQVGRLAGQLKESEQPPAVARLHPKWVLAESDEKGRRAVRLLWGSGMIGSLSLVVGREDMPTPPSDASRPGERRYPLAPGAYISSSD
jgi:hypothetical protein